MKLNTDIFKIQSNDVIPSRGKILISEPFLRDNMFGRSVVLLIDHTSEGSMGLVMNKQLPFTLNQAIREFQYLEEELIVYKGGPIASDTLFFIHTLPQIPDALPVCKGLYLNGDFNAIKEYVISGHPVKNHIRFFLGYSGWETNQLDLEIKENTWIIGKAEISELMSSKDSTMWEAVLGKLGAKYKTWSRFPQIPELN